MAALFEAWPGVSICADAMRSVPPVAVGTSHRGDRAITWIYRYRRQGAQLWVHDGIMATEMDIITQALCRTGEIQVYGTCNLPRCWVPSSHRSHSPSPWLAGCP